MLDPCISAVLCTLTAPVLISLRTIVDSNIVQIQALVASLQARSVLLGIQAVPIQVVRDQLVPLLQEVESTANILPITLLNQCPPLGQLQADWTDASRRATASVQDLADDLTRTVSLKTGLDAQLAELQATLAELQLLSAEISACITQVQTP